MTSNNVVNRSGRLRGFWRQSPQRPPGYAGRQAGIDFNQGRILHESTKRDGCVEDHRNP